MRERLGSLSCLMNPYEPPRPFDPGEAQWVDYPKLAKRLKTLGIVQMAFGGLGLLGTLSGLVPPKRDPISRQVHDALWNGEIATWMRVSTGIGILLTLILLAAGFSLYKHRPLGRTLSLVHAGAALVVGTVSYFVTRDVMDKMMNDLAKTMGPAAEVFRTSMSVAQGFGLVMGLVLYGVEAYIVTRPGVKELLAQSQQHPM